MNIRPLIIDDEAKAKAARVLAHAEANPYRPEDAKEAPGDDPNFVANFGTYRAVFTFTHSLRGIVYRHLSVSVPSANYPNPAAAFMIATLFGFTGWDECTIDRAPPGWMMEINTGDCIVLAQEYRSHQDV